MNLFADRLKELRLARGLTIKQAARELQIHPTTLTQYERWMTRPKIDIVLRATNFYNVTSDWLLGRDILKQ